MAEKLIVPGHIADMKYVIPAIQVYYQANDWLNTADYIDREFHILKANGTEDTKKKDNTDYTKDAELARYFGFVERKTPGDIRSDCRITKSGKAFYESYINNDYPTIWSILMDALENVTFGRNNEGCPNSNTRLEAPNILMISSLLLDGISRKEYASILFQMLKKSESLVNAIVHIKLSRLNNNEIVDTIRVDNKVIPFFVTLKFLEDVDGRLIISKVVRERFQERIAKLRPTNDEDVLFQADDLNFDSVDFNEPLQQIFYGAPGTGKSNEIKRLTGDGTFSKNYTFRTTFHPDFDYSTFVGAYKPIWNNDKGKIVYEFRPQTFLKAYVAAWTHPSENVALVIEEINRGNCAQIFGDIFQLLDRENNGLSKYPIESDIDMEYFLSRALSGEIEEPWTGIIPEDDKEKINEYYSKHYDDAFAKIKSGEILTLPKNLSILATMNTSDQSLFPMDSAFKRRWEWQYMPIKNANKNWVIHLADNYENIDWWEFLERINNVISDLTTSEDKQLGYFFCQPDSFVNPNHAPDAKPDLISAKRFVDKVIFYLWNDVFKDYAFDAKCCKDKDSKEVLFAKFYNEDGKSVNIDILKHFFETLTVENKPSLVEKIVPPTDASGEEELSKTDVSSVDEEPNSTDKVSEEADLFTSATTGE